MTSCDLLVIGAGPAGMAAATTAAEHGANVFLLDEQQQAGGQIYRALEHCTESQANILGEDYLYGNTLLSELASSKTTTIYGASVWRVDHDGTVTYTQADTTHQLHARHIIIATGALERPCPIPGWTLPGVMTAGAAQILLKSSGLAATNAVLAGTGPLLYAIAVQLIRAGTPPAALVDTQQRRHYLQAARYLPAAAASAATLSKGIGYLRRIKAAGVPFYRATNNLHINGNSHAQEIEFITRGRKVTLKTQSILLHQGVVPNTQITRSLRLDHQWDTTQRCFFPITDVWGQSSAEKISVAGDGGGIGGAINAELQGRVVACGALASLGIISESSRNEYCSKPLRLLLKETKLRRFLDHLYPPSTEVTQPQDQTIVCRCEEVTAGAIRGYTELGCTGPNQTKAFGRCGMGPCQGRYCGLTVTEILAEKNALPHDEVGSYRIRAPIKPVTLAELASFDSKQP